MSDLFFYSAVGAFLVGVTLGSLYVFSLPTVVWVLGVALVLGVVAGGRVGGAPPARYLLLTSVLLCALGVGLLRFHFVVPVTTPALNTSLGETVTLIGVVVREPDIRARTQALALDVGDTLVRVQTDRYQTIKYGDRLEVSGRLELPASFTTDLGRTFNYPAYLNARGIGYTISFADVSVIVRDEDNPVISFLLEQKQRFMRQIESLIPEPEVGLAEGLLLGVKQALGDEYETIFRRAGITHIVVLSGYNVMLVVTFFMYTLAYILPYRWRLVVGMIGIAGFALLVGLSATVVRASIMASLLLFLRFSGNTYHLVRALFLAGVIMLLFNPYLLLADVGFQLSFVATLALIVAAPHLERYFTFMPIVFGLREFLIATVVTQLFVLPLLLYHIGEVSVVSVVVNVLVLPMVPVAMLLTFITGMISFVSATLALPTAFLAYWSLAYIISVASFFAALPFATYVVPTFSLAALLCAYVLLLLCWRLVVHKQKNVSSSAFGSFSTTSSTDVSSWTIEEDDEAKEQSSFASSDARPKANDLPIFFR